MSLQSLISKMNILRKTKRMELSVASSMLTATADRIFTKGLDAKGSPIGTYSKGYMKTRIKKNYPSSTKVILQADGQMVSDWSVINEGDDLGLGFKNNARIAPKEGKKKKSVSNLEKSEYVEATYGKPIFEHTSNELKSLNDLLNKEVKKILNG